MKNNIGFLLFPLFLLGCSGSNNISSSWKEPQIGPIKFEKLAIIVMSPSLSIRTISEYAIFDVFKEKQKVIPTFDIFPFAGQISKLTEDMTEEEIAAKIKEKIERHNIDGLLIISVLEKIRNAEKCFPVTLED